MKESFDVVVCLSGPANTGERIRQLASYGDESDGRRTRPRDARISLLESIDRSVGCDEEEDFFSIEQLFKFPVVEKKEFFESRSHDEKESNPSAAYKNKKLLISVIISTSV